VPPLCSGCRRRRKKPQEITIAIWSASLIALLQFRKSFGRAQATDLHVSVSV
jgi:hypothetical protein